MRNRFSPTQLRKRSLLLSIEGLEDRTTPATFTVTNAVDGGSGSLRDILAQANAAPGADTITFASALAGQTISLTLVGDVSAGTSSLLVPAGSDITIAGTGQSIIRSRAVTTSEYRLFTVAAGAKLALQNMTFSNGLAHGGNGVSGGGGAAGLGGAIYNIGSLSVSGCTFVGNSAVGGGGSGSSGFGGGGGGMHGSGSPSGPGGPPNGSSSLGGNGGFGGGGGGGGGVSPGNGGGGGFGGGGGGGGGGGNGPGSGLGQGGNGGFGGGGGASGGTGGAGTGNFGGGIGTDFASGHGGGGGAGMGGAIFNQGGMVAIVNSTFQGNTAQGGDTPVSNAGGGGCIG